MSMNGKAIVPESAPFNDAQRQWLNGFIEGWLGDEATSGTNGSAPEAPAEEADDFPWHDETMPLDERMALAEDRAFPLQLMAAMGQQDCGQCGYLCKSYADALASGAESNAGLCTPGGRETRVLVKDLLTRHADEIGGDSAAPAAANDAPGTRGHPLPAKVVSVTELTGSTSTKDIRHLILDLGPSGLQYRAGDSLGLWVTNAPDLVAALLDHLQVSATALCLCAGQIVSAHEALFRTKDITKPSDELLELLHANAEGAARDDLATLVSDGLEDGVDVLDLLQRFREVPVDPFAVIASLAPLQPRLYSISSSPLAHAGQVHATIAAVRYEREGRERYGVASTFVADRCQAGDPLPAYIQPTADFLLPADGDADMIMIGPGTGIAPFRAFLHEREANGAKGRHWLFFGNPNAATDFLYEDELRAWQARGVLHELELAFSRDQAEKIYVQHRLLARAAQVWEWLEGGAFVYVCGDASRMAVDVHQALLSIVREQGGHDEADAAAYLKAMGAEHRYLKDVY